MKKTFLYPGLILTFFLAACGQLAPKPTATGIATSSAWQDHSIFRSGLVSDQQKVLDRLPGASVYHIEMTLDPGYTSLHGHEQVQYTNRESTDLNEIYFQLFPNQEGGESLIANLKVAGKATQPVYETDKSALKVTLPAALEPGQETTLEMDFEVTVPTQTGGNYGLFAYASDLLALDGFYPAIPVYDEKGWHEGKIPPNSDTTYQDASFYVVEVSAPKALILAASGIQVSRSTHGNQQTVTFAAGPARDFYLAGSEKYVVHSQTSGETTVNVYTMKDQKNGASSALDSATHALNDYSARFGGYPYTEFDVVSIPMEGAYGIEYPGITGINHTLFDSGTGSDGTPRTVLLESTVAHEIGHQWFYNLVGDDQANEPWLDEAVTQYATGLYYLDRYGESGWQGYSATWSYRWERVNREDLPVGLPAGDYSGKEYSAIVYGRGPLFLAALAEKMGPSTFDEFLRDYVQQNAWGIATTASFKALAESHCGCDLSPLFNEWVFAK